MRLNGSRSPTTLPDLCAAHESFRPSKCRIAAMPALFAMLVTAILVLVPAIAAPPRISNIFDDDWTPPAPRSQSQLPTISPATAPANSSPDPAVPAPPSLLPGNEPPRRVSQSAPVEPTKSRQPPPDRSAQAHSRKLFKDVFAKELADRSMPARRALAKQLIDEAEKVNDNPSDRFVLLIGATEAGAQGADLRLCIRAADALTAAFDIDGLRLKSDAALKTTLRGESATIAAENCRAGLQLFDQLLLADDYPTAARLVPGLRSAAAGNPALAQQVQRRATHLDAVRAGFDRIAKDIEHLRASPTDPASNLVVGRFLCFVKGDWAAGLPLMALGADSKLAALAKQDLSSSGDPKQQGAVADLWWDLAEKETSLSEQEIRRHAARCYQSSLAALTGLAKARAEKRIQSIEPDTGQSVVDLLKLIDPAKDTVQGTFAIENGQLISTGEGEQRIEARYLPPEEYDFEIEFTKVDNDRVVIQMLSKKQMPFIWVIGKDDAIFHYVKGGGDFGNETSVRLKKPMEQGVRYRSLVQVRNDGVKVYLDGKLIKEWKTDYTNIDANRPFWALRNKSYLGVGVAGKVIFHVARVAEITGKGQVKTEAAGK